MENLIAQTLGYFQWGVSRYKGEKKIAKVNSIFGNNYLSIVIVIVFNNKLFANI